jgi:NADH dehydrogenase
VDSPNVSDFRGARQRRIPASTSLVEDLAELAVNAAQETRNVELDAVGPEIFTFNELVRLLAGILGKTARIVYVPPMVALLCTTILGRLMGDVMLTADEIRGLVANLRKF